MHSRCKAALERWFIRPSSGIHLDVADGFRGLAIVMVVVAHGFYANPHGPAVFLNVTEWLGAGTLGVPIFFVLSGFLLSIPFLRARQQNPAFWYHEGFVSRRVLKIIPPFYLTIVVLAPLYYLIYRDADYFKVGFAWATGIAHFIWFPKRLNGSFWSLWVEIGFYAMLPLLFRATSGRSVKASGWMIFLFLLIVSAVSRFFLWNGPMQQPDQWFFITSRFPSSLDFFAWGVLFATLYVSLSQGGRCRRRLSQLGYLGLIVMACAAVQIFWFNHFAPPDQAPSRWGVECRHFLPGLGSFLLLFFVFDADCLPARFFGSSLMRFLGLVSYEWFLIHQPAEQLCRFWTTGSHGSFIRYIWIVTIPPLVSLGLAVLIYHKFSLPIMRWGRAKLKKEPGTPQTVRQEPEPVRQVVPHS